MLKVSVSDIQPIISSKMAKNGKNLNLVKTAKISAKNTVKKAIPSIVMLANGTFAMVAANKADNSKKCNYEPCSDFCCEIVG